jgi:hypothetical protein
MAPKHFSAAMRHQEIHGEPQANVKKNHYQEEGYGAAREKDRGLICVRHTGVSGGVQTEPTASTRFRSSQPGTYSQKEILPA